MKSYIHYVHDISDEKSVWNFYSQGKRKKVKDVRSRFNSINELEQAIIDESNGGVFSFISEHLDLQKYFRHIVFSTENKSYVDNVDFTNVRAIVNFKLINHIREINKHFVSVNKLLPDAGIYIGRCESYYERRIRFYKRFGRKFGRFMWFVDFILHRVFPKLRPFSSIYKFIFRRRPHVVSKAEILGRLVYNGFEVIEFRIIDGLLYFVVMKTSEPENCDAEPTYYPLIKLQRVGKNGEMFKVFKFRTMYPYSEYLQDYVLSLNGYNEVGKPSDDFRVAGWGKIFRKLWLDEFPQLINVLKGEMKIVGVRPLSQVRFNELPVKLQEERITHKPGCFPPYVALNMPDSQGNIKAEEIYLNDLAKHPHTTNIRYLLKAVFNILGNKIRSS
jgi:hypothetical protein